jgi:hypothetical protein
MKLLIAMPLRQTTGVVESLLRLAVLNRDAALGMPVTQPAGYLCLGQGEARPAPDLRNKAGAAPNGQVWGVVLGVGNIVRISQ